MSSVCEASTSAPEMVNWGQPLQFLPMEQRHQFMHSLQKCRITMQQMFASGKHPNRDLGGEGIDVDLNRVITQTRFQVDHVLIHAGARQDRAHMLHLLSDAHQVLYKRHERPDDLQMALELCEEAQSGFPPEDEEIRKEVMGKLSQLYHFKYLETHLTDNLVQGIEWAEKVIVLTPPGTGLWAWRAHVLSNLLYDLYSRKGDPEHLDQSISWMSKSIKEHPPGRELRAATGLLGDRLQSKYQLTGAAVDLQQSLMYAQKALNETNEEDPEFGIRLIRLANKRMLRYERSQNEEDLDSAIALATQAIETDMEVEGFQITCNSLGASFHHKFKLSKNMEDIDQAIHWTEISVALSPTSDLHYPLFLFNLGNRLLARYEAKNDLSAVIIDDATPSPSNTRLLDFLFQPREERHSQLKIDDLNAAIDHYKGALAALPTDSVHRAIMLLKTGKILASRYFCMYGLADLQDSIKFYIEASDYQFARPLERIDAARQAGDLYGLQKDWIMATSCMARALDLLPLVSPRSLQRDDQQHMLAQFSGTAAQAASFALEAGYPAYEAVRLLELGRGMIMSFTIDLRSDISSLRTDHPDIFLKFNGLRNTISEESPRLEDSSGANFSWESEQMDSIAKRTTGRRSLEASYKLLESLIEEIRALDGYEKFLLPLTETEMMDLAGNGAIVVVNPTKLRCDALIITSSSFRNLRLPDLRYEDIEHNIDEMDLIFAQTRMETRGRDNKKLSKILLWLWETVVGPICQELDLESKEKTVENICWIGVGALSRAPFHAAGKHPSKTKNAFSLVKSSCIPTIKALWYARQVVKPQGRAVQMQIKLISMPDTPGHARLPNVEDELRCIHEIADTRVKVETFSRPSKTQILRQLRESHGDNDALQIVHFACHGVSDPSNPLESHVLLLEDADSSFSSSDKSTEPQAAKLSVREVSSMKVESAYLAYLGACHTANNSVMKLADEGLHVVSSFQLAGFRHVIGNMWKADDESCRLFSKEFYSHLLVDEGVARGDVGMVEVSKAFHHALKKVRKSAPGDFIGWIPFVHSGA